MQWNVSFQKVDPLPNEFPCLKTLAEYPDYVVLFTSETTGVVLAEGSKRNPRYPVGKHVTSKWTYKSFIPFEGSITLSN